MRNWIKFRGFDVDSRDVRGLIIQELPPITVPPIRYDEVEIDGIDGDIIIPKGYGAYDRTVRIGVTPDANLNEVAEFFNRNGECIFSNEPEFVYQVERLEQIDMQRLGRFREADVKLHCQPFKTLVDINDSFVELHNLVTAAWLENGVYEAQNEWQGITVNDGQTMEIFYYNSSTRGVFEIPIQMPNYLPLVMENEATMTVHLTDVGGTSNYNGGYTTFTLVSNDYAITPSVSVGRLTTGQDTSVSQWFFYTPSKEFTRMMVTVDAGYYAEFKAAVVVNNTATFTNMGNVESAPLITVQCTASEQIQLEFSEVNATIEIDFARMIEDLGYTDGSAAYIDLSNGEVTSINEFSLVDYVTSNVPLEQIRFQPGFEYVLSCTNNSVAVASESLIVTFENLSRWV